MKRNKKWNPEKRFNGLSREEYVMLPWKQFMPEKVEPTGEVTGEVNAQVTGEVSP
jgi:hypothetical protein